ncbi:MAG: hypothetical protein HQ547_03830 [Candidatus Omnitrophica bacterium]|nr:hypothetical protein [Candidatus Omnitrophota bacterium]
MRKTRPLLPIFILSFLVTIQSTLLAELYTEDQTEAQETTAHPRKIIPIGNLEIVGAYSDIDEGSDLWGGGISGSFSPALRLSDMYHLIPLYSGSYKRIRQYVAQEEGGRLYNTWQIHNASLALRSQLTDKLSRRITAFGTWNLVKETRDEAFGDGLYDYRDTGGSLDMRYKFVTPNKEKVIDHNWGFQFFHRKYPNFQSLISLATVTAAEKNEKDFNAVKFSAGRAERSADGARWEINPSLSLKYFVDKQLIDEDGTLDMDEEREDYIVQVDFKGVRPFKAGRWEAALENSIIYNYSNLDFYDSRDTVVLTDDVFTKHYYTYFSALIYPYLTYYHALNREKMIMLRAGYSVLFRNYLNRKAQDSSGAYTDTDQKDKIHAIRLSASYPITKLISWVTSFDYTFADSNHKYEKYYKYDYDVYQTQSGISIKF